MKRRTKTRAGRSVWQLLLIVLLLALLVLMLIVEAKRSHAAIVRERVTFSTYTYTDLLEGYVFREEVEVTDGGNNGPVEYKATDGAAVTAKDALALTYSEVTGQNERETAARLYAEIAELESSLQQTDWQKDYVSSYANMMAAVNGGDWQTGMDAAGVLSVALRQGSVATVEGSEAAAVARIEVLRAQIAELVQWAGEPKTVTAPIDGYFSSSVDGYEGVFSLPNVAGVTPESLELWLNHKEASDAAIGKVVGGGAFYLAVPVTPETAALYTVQETYAVHMLRGGTCSMLLERVSFSVDGTRALLVLRADQMPEGMDLERRQPIRVERMTVSGLRIPVTALQADGERAFVYVDQNGIAQRREVRVLCMRHGCCLALPSTEVGYLQENEQLLITARSVYEGKVLRK